MISDTSSCGAACVQPAGITMAPRPVRATDPAAAVIRPPPPGLFTGLRPGGRLPLRERCSIQQALPRARGGIGGHCECEPVGPVEDDKALLGTGHARLGLGLHCGGEHRHEVGLCTEEIRSD